MRLWTQRLSLTLCVALLFSGCEKTERAGARKSAMERKNPVPAETRTMTPLAEHPRENKQPERIVKPMEPTPAAAQAASYQESDMVSLTELDPTIIADSPLAGTNNAFHYQFFKSSEAWLRYGTAKKLVEIQKELRARGLGLKIWAAYRPFVVQMKMFELVGRNSDWVSDPYRDSGKKTHVRGVAIDCTLVDQNGKELAMPTPYLDFRLGAEKMKQNYPNLPRKVLANRELLHSVMTAHGMEPYAGEWWHFQDANWPQYPVLGENDFPQIRRRLLTDEMLAMK